MLLSSRFLGVPMGEKNPFKGPIKRTEIPIYIEDVERYRRESFPVKEVKEQEPSEIRKAIQESLSSVRHQFTDIYDKYQEDYKYVQGKIDTGVAHASVTLDYLRQEENDLPRAGAVAMAGMTGLILGLRGGFFKRLIYTSVTATGMAGLCYPQQAVEISKDLMVNSKKYAAIGYNFINGVKPNDSNPTNNTAKAEAPKSGSSLNKIQGDIGQSNPADKDLYTTRA